MKKKTNPFDVAIKDIEKRFPIIDIYDVSPLNLLSDLSFDFLIDKLGRDNLMSHSSVEIYYEVLYLRLLFAREMWEDENN